MTDLEEAQAILDERVAELNARYNGRPGFPVAYFDLKGGGRAVYVTIEIGGMTRDGHVLAFKEPAVVATPKEAVEGWYLAVRAYAFPLSGVLYWRRPARVYLQDEIAADNKNFLRPCKAGWRCNARLVIVDGEPDLTPEAERDTPADYKGWDDMIAKYRAGIPT